ncbi:MAG TPA: NAD(P)/FAD-dependent oxidoreductase [Sphingomicrobium sp.]|nr:NAD(P)/FAD-dependent oxidoreductase [Sphingomicrobium sp.]
MENGSPPAQHVDVLIVGAGLSGVGAAWRLKERCPGKSWLILEGRNRIGGTWDLFRYPGIRSDSDIFTLGFPFRPWPSDRAIVDGPSIRDYVEDTARESGIFNRIRFGHQVKNASWSSADARWTVETDAQTFTCAFLYLCTGYYDFAAGYRPIWPSEEDFQGRIVHPQFWPYDLDYSGKRIAVIGSGATAVTLIPAMAVTAAHVTMVQRSPTYIVSRPARDRIAAALQKILPAPAAHFLTRWKNVLLTIYVYGRSRKNPKKVADWIVDQAGRQLPAGYPVTRDFRPSYNPWDQRLCLVPDGDLFTAIRGGNVSIATGAIDRFTPAGIRLTGGEEIPADIIVTATGLNLKLAGGISLMVDGARVTLADRTLYKGMMLNGVPNLAISVGYINASWTLRSDITARAVCRLLNHLDGRGLAVATPRDDPSPERRPLLELSSGYLARAEGLLPRQGLAHPWRVRQNYVRDLVAMTFSRTSEALDFRKAG